MIDSILSWAPLVLSVVQLLLAWVLWSMRQEFVRRVDCGKERDGMAKCHIDLAHRVAAAEADIGNMPRPAAWSKMQVAMEEVRGSNKVLLAKLEGQSEILKRIEHPVQLLMEHHLKGDK